VREILKGMLMKLCFAAFKSMIKEDFPAKHDTPCGWKAVAECSELAASTARIRSMEWKTSATLACLQATSTAMTALDREVWMQELANDAQIVNDRGDYKEVYRIVRFLGGKTKCADAACLEDENGKPAKNEKEREQVWVKHYKKVFNGEIVATIDAGKQSSDICEHPTNFVVNEEGVCNAVSRLKRGKGVGLDGIPAELLQSGGFTTVMQLTKVCEKIVEQDRWPRTWTGGTMVSIYKQKGGKKSTDSYRGILLMDHSAKAFSYLLRDWMSRTTCTSRSCSAGRPGARAPTLPRIWLSRRSPTQSMKHSRLPCSSSTWSRRSTGS
jgi:hypothetical protein